MSPRLRYGTVLNGALSPWRPTEIPAWFAPVLSFFLACFAVNRGLDLYRSPTSTSEINVALDLLGQDGWGISFMLVGLGVLASYLPWARRNIIVVITHTCTLGVYVGYATTLTLGWAMTDHLYGSRFPGAVISLSVVWAALTVAAVNSMFRNLSTVDKPLERRSGTRRAEDRGARA